MMETDRREKRPSRSHKLVRVTFEIEVPEQTPKEAKIYVCGDIPILGSWSEAGVVLKSIASRKYQGFIMVEAGTSFSWKVTRGRWASVEKLASGADVDNRAATVAADVTYEIKIAGWADGGKEAAPAPPTAPASPGAAPSRTVCDHVRLLGRFGRAATKEERPVWVHVPPGYSETGTERYPVLYMLDGQNCFDPSIAFLGRDWGAGVVQDKLIAEGVVRPFIICAIAHPMDRSYEYTPVPDYFFEGGGLHTLADLIEKEVGPALRARYRIREGPEATGIMGSSLGGLAAFHMGWRHPERFGLVGVISPSLWWAGRQTLKTVSQSTKPSSRTRFWIDMGAYESRYPKMLINSVRQLTNLLRSRGFAAHCYIDPAGSHDEPSWRKRLHLPFEWLYGTKRP